MTAFTFSKKKRPGVRFSLLIAGMVLAACLTRVTTCIAVENDCEKLLSQEAFKKLDKEKIKTIQLSLVATGYNPKEIDGVIGPHSRAALLKFCADFKNEFRQDSIDSFLATLFLYAAIAKEEPAKYPEWKKIALSNEFKSWINKQPLWQRIPMHQEMFV